MDDHAPEAQLLTPDELAGAWSAHRAGRFGLMTIRPPVEKPDLATAVRAAITTTTAHLTGHVLGNSFDVNMGLSGIERLLADLDDTTTKKGWKRRFGTPDAFAVGMTRLAECLTSAHTAPAAGRSFYAQFLAEAGPTTGIDFGAAVHSAEDARTQWAGIADTAATATEPDVTIPELALRVGSVLEVERRLIAELQQALTR